MTEERTIVPPIVKALAEKEGKLPLGWFIDDVHVSIVYQDGIKVNYLRDVPVDPKPLKAQHPAPVQPPPAQPKGKPRTSKKK
jgi:hypothetical protein